MKKLKPKLVLCTECIFYPLSCSTCSNSYVSKSKNNS